MMAMIWKIRDPKCGGVLEAQAPVIAAYWADRAAESERIAKVLDGITKSGGWMQGIAVHAPLVMIVFQHHVAPALEARQRAAQSGEPTANGQAVIEEGTEAIDPETGQVVVFLDGAWHYRDEPGPATEPASRTEAALTNEDSELPNVDRWGHERGDTGRPSDDADSADA